MRLRKLLVAMVAGLSAIVTISATPASAAVPTISHPVRPLTGPYPSCEPPVHAQRRNSTTIEVWVDSVDFRNQYYEAILYVTLANSKLQPINAGGPWYVGPTQGFDKTFTLPTSGYVGFNLTDADTAHELCITDVHHV